MRVAHYDASRVGPPQGIPFALSIDDGDQTQCPDEPFRLVESLTTDRGERQSKSQRDQWDSVPPGKRHLPKPRRFQALG